MAKKGTETMGRLLQRLRQEAGMSQPQLADAAGIPVSTLRNWEYDRRSPRLETAAKVAKALGVSLDVLAEAEPAHEPRQPKKPMGKKGR